MGCGLATRDLRLDARPAQAAWKSCHPPRNTNAGSPCGSAWNAALGQDRVRRRSCASKQAGAPVGHGPQGRTRSSAGGMHADGAGRLSSVFGWLVNHPRLSGTLCCEGAAPEKLAGGMLYRTRVGSARRAFVTADPASKRDILYRSLSECGILADAAAQYAEAENSRRGLETPEGSGHAHVLCAPPLSGQAIRAITVHAQSRKTGAGPRRPPTPYRRRARVFRRPALPLPAAIQVLVCEAGSRDGPLWLSSSHAPSSTSCQLNPETVFSNLSLGPSFSIPGNPGCPPRLRCAAPLRML